METFYALFLTLRGHSWKPTSNGNLLQSVREHGKTQGRIPRREPRCNKFTQNIISEKGNQWGMEKMSGWGGQIPCIFD